MNLTHFSILANGAYPFVLYGMLALAPVVFLLLLFVSAPYGRHVRSGWGPEISSRAGWLIMESPACLVMAGVVLFLPYNLTLFGLLLVWQVHYFHRAFVYPFTLRTTRRMPVVLVLMAIVFNVINAYLNGWHFVMHASWYGQAWFTRPTTLAGLVIFAVGYFVTRRSDAMLRDMRKEADGYQVPTGFLYRWVSCPNYLGESIQWFGWCLLTLSPAAWVFLLWTLANLVPRAISHHQWYRRSFSDYPQDRKAFIPYLF